MCAVLLLSLPSVGLLLGDGDKPPGHIDNIRQGLGSIESEQRLAEESLGRIEAGIDRSEEGAGRLADSIDRSVTIIERVEERADNAAGAINRAAGGNEAARRIIEDSQRRVTECQGIISEVREGTR